MPGMGELLIILLIVLLIFGAGKLPAIGDSLGRSIKNFKRASKGDDEIEVKKTGSLEGSKARNLDAGRGDDDDSADDAEEVAVRRKARRSES
ncbi:MAG: twin-arginine translocase TatA/TatE family subunit [Kofleriaceae bacterium]